MHVNQLCNLIDSQKEELFQLLSDLIKINSESFLSYGNEENIARYIEGLCKELGLEADVFSPLEINHFESHPDYFPGRNLENRYNVVATWKGKEDKNGLMLMAHEDTVEIGNRENWHEDPTGGGIKKGRIYGRGACDDKYSIATILFVIKLLKENGFVPKENILFAAYSDEEYGGSHGALSCVLKYPCEHIVSMDGEENQIWNCSSGGGEMKYMFRTMDTVDSAQRTATAIPIIMEEMEKFAANRCKELEENRFYSGTIIPETSLRYMGIRAGYNGMDLGRGEVYFVYYTDKTKEQIEAEFSGLESVLAQRLAGIGIIGEGFKQNTRFFHYEFCEPNSDDIKLMLEASREVTGKEPVVCGSCLSDLSVILKYGSGKAFAFGAGRNFNKEGGAHQADEFIECDKLIDYAKTIAAYIVKLL